MNWLLVFLCAWPALLAGESFHALIACDTDLELETSAKQDISHVRTALREISLQTGLHLSMHFLSGNRLSANSIHSWIKKLEHKPPNVVLFYYSGHGFRSEIIHSPWPCLFLPKKVESVPSEPIYQRLYAIGSRLVIIILDCCNTPLAFKHPRRAVREKSPLPGLKTLFLYTKGMIIAAGSSPGESAFALPDGSLFTNSWLHALRSHTASDDISWKEIFDATYVLCSPMQRPIFSLEIDAQQPNTKESHAGKVRRHSTDVETIICMAS